MPKLKTNRGASKRFHFTASGKIKRKKAYLRHILTSKGQARKRHLRGEGYVHPSNAKQVKQLLPYG